MWVLDESNCCTISNTSHAFLAGLLLQGYLPTVGMHVGDTGSAAAGSNPSPTLHALYLVSQHIDCLS